jgi:hypothetical protein
MKHVEFTEEEYRAVVDATVRIFRAVAAPFPHASVRTDLPAYGNPVPPGVVGTIELSCSIPGTATVTAIPDADEINMTFGEDTWIEYFPVRLEPDGDIPYVRMKLEAVVEGRFGEKLRILGGRVQASRNVFARHPDQVRRLLRRRPIFLPGRTRTIAYAPYG